MTGVRITVVGITIMFAIAVVMITMVIIIMFTITVIVIMGIITDSRHSTSLFFAPLNFWIAATEDLVIASFISECTFFVTVIGTNFIFTPAVRPSILFIRPIFDRQSRLIHNQTTVDEEVVFRERYLGAS